MTNSINKIYNFEGRIIAITGGAGFLGQQHAEAVAEFGAVPVILDLPKSSVEDASKRIAKKYGVKSMGFVADITSEKQVSQCCRNVLSKFGRIDALINNAANNPKVESGKERLNFSRLEKFDLKLWNKDLAVGLTGAFLCSKHFGQAISRNPRGGTIINISSDLGLISPDQRLYHKDGLPENQQQVKPVSYSVIKAGLLGLTRYLATYWADKNVRCNALCPGGIQNNQNQKFVQRLNRLIPLGRMARHGEYKGIIVFLCSDAASYMNGAIISIDGGRVVW